MHRLSYLLPIVLLALGNSPLQAQAVEPDPVPVSYFAVPDFKTLPPNIKVLSEKTVEGVKVTEFYFAGAPFNNKPTRIYAFYCQPAKKGIYPAVVEVHGAGRGGREIKHVSGCTYENYGSPP